jgi:hypothetical protein
MSPNLGGKFQPVDLQRSDFHEHAILARKNDITTSSQTA